MEWNLVDSATSVRSLERNQLEPEFDGAFRSEDYCEMDCHILQGSDSLLLRRKASYENHWQGAQRGSIKRSSRCSKPHIPYQTPYSCNPEDGPEEHRHFDQGLAQSIEYGTEYHLAGVTALC